MHDGVLGVAGGEQHLECRAGAADLVGELPAVHATRHDHVGEQQVELRAAVDQRQRLGGVGRRQRRVAEALQLRDHVVAHQRVVLDHQDGLAAACIAGARLGAPLAGAARRARGR